MDDLVVTGNNGSFISQFLHALSVRFSIKDLGDLHYFLGVEVIPTAMGLFLTQHKYIRDLLTKTNLAGAKEVTTPLSTSQPLCLNDGSPLSDATQYRQVIGRLQYLALTRPDISFTVNKLAQFMHQPTETHWSTVKRLLRYLKHTIHHGLFLKHNQPLHLSAFSDADWAGNKDDRTSTTAYIIYLGGNAISWCSRKQKSVARSSTEAEYRALASTAAEVLWLKNLLGELGVSLPRCPTIYCDNIGATYLSVNPVFHSKMKHIAIDNHFVRDHVTTGNFGVSYISTKDQLADILTKPLSRQLFTTLRNKIGISNGSTILRGHNRPAHYSPKPAHSSPDSHPENQAKSNDSPDSHPTV